MTAGLQSPSGAGRDAGYSRVTVIGRRRRADLVLPSGEPIGALLPELLDVLGEPTSGDPRRLGIATASGDLLAPDLTLAGGNVPDGALLRLVAEDEIPPPPVVTDVTEETAADLERRRGRWSPTARTATSTAAAAALAGLAALQATLRAPGHEPLVALVVAAIACGVVGLGFAAPGRARPAVAFAAAGAAVAGVDCVVTASAHGWPVVQRIGAAEVAGWLAVGIGGLAWRSRGPVLGALLGLLLGAGWLLLQHSGLAPVEAAAIVASAGVVALGTLPRWALTTSGLTALDDRRMTGEVVARPALEGALLSAHAVLTWSTVAAAIGVAAAGATLASADRVWPTLLAMTVALVVLLRGRGAPLTVEVAVLVTAGLVVAATAALRWSAGPAHPGWSVVVGALGSVAALVVLTAEPPPHVRARLRGIGDRLESFAVMALIPMLVGVFGVFGRLLGSF